MRLNLQHFSIASTDGLDLWVNLQILALGRLRQIDEANVGLARHPEKRSGKTKIQLSAPGSKSRGLSPH